MSIPFQPQPQINNFQSVNMLPHIGLDNRSPQLASQLGGMSGSAFGSGKVGSNNGSSSGGSVFSGVGHKSGNHWTLGNKGGDNSQGKMKFNESGGGLMLNKMRSGSSMGSGGGSFLSKHHNKGLKMSRQISTGGSGALDPNNIYPSQPLKLI